MFSRPHASTAQPSRPTTAAYSSLKPCTPGAWLGEARGPFHSTPSSRTAASATAARLVAAVERVLGNTVISQFQAAQSDLTVLEELQVMRKAA